MFLESWSFSCVIKEVYARNFCQFIVGLRNKQSFFLNVERFREEPDCEWSEYVGRLPAEIDVMIRNGPSYCVEQGIKFSEEFDALHF